MSELIIEILVYLSAAALIGLLLGYAVWGWGQAARISDARADGAASARTSVDGDAGLRTQLNACIKERKRLEAEVERLGRTILELRQNTAVPEEIAPAAASGGQPGARRIGAEDGPPDGSRDAILEEVGTVEAAPPPAPPPSLLAEPPETVDDLKRIKGVGKIMEGVLNSKGIFLFHQLANFSDDDIAWVNTAIDAFPGRIERDDWVGQAKDLYREKYGRSHTETDR